MTIQPSGCQPQAADRIHTTEPSTTARMMNADSRMRSITEPDMMDAVVQANRVNAPQNTPVALSARFGPIDALHGTADAPASKFGMKPAVIDR